MCFSRKRTPLRGKGPHFSGRGLLSSDMTRARRTKKAGLLSSDMTRARRTKKAAPVDHDDLTAHVICTRCQGRNVKTDEICKYCVENEKPIGRPLHGKDAKGRPYSVPADAFFAAMAAEGDKR